MKFYRVIILFLFISNIAIAQNNNRMQYEDLLKLSEKERIEKKYAKALETLNEIKVAAANNGWTDLQILALNNLGVVYMELLDYEKAIEFYLEGYKIAIEQGHKQKEIIILNNISKIYIINNEIDKAKEYLNRAYEGARQLNDSLRMGRYAANLGFLANKTGEYELGEKYVNNALDILKQTQNSIIVLSEIKLTKVDNLYLQKRYNEAEQLITEILSELNVKNDDLRGECLLFLARIYQQKNDYKQSAQMASEALALDITLMLRIELYEFSSHLHRDNNAFLPALQYKDSLMILKDSLMQMNDKDRVTNAQIRFDLLNSEKALMENKAKQKEERTFFLFIILFITILAIVLLWVQFLKNKQRKVLDLEKEKNEKILLRQQLSEQKTLALLEQERLNNEINEKNRQLTSRVLLQSNKNKLIEEIVDTLSVIPEQSKNKTLNSIIQQLKKQLKESSEWDSFLVHFEQINPAFLSLLKEKHPNLTANDIRLLSYIYLNLSTKEIASLLNITFESCKKKKQRLASKIGIETAGLYNYLAKIKNSL